MELSVKSITVLIPSAASAFKSSGLGLTRDKSARPFDRNYQSRCSEIGCRVTSQMKKRERANQGDDGNKGWGRLSNNTHLKFSLCSLKIELIIGGVDIANQIGREIVVSNRPF